MLRREFIRSRSGEIMTGYIGCFGLLGIAVFIAFLFLRRKKIESEMTQFYKENSLYTSENCPPNVRESLDAMSDNLYCCRANLRNAAGENVEFCWWEWYLKSSQMINGAPSISFDQYLAVSFAPGAVSGEFISKAIRWADKSGDDFSQKAKDFFVNNADTPYRAEILADGSLIICWHTVTKRRAVYEAKIAWLKNNAAPPPAPEIITPEKVEEVMPEQSRIIETAAPDETKPIEISAPDESKTAGTVFYTHDSYATLRHKFNAAWTNLELELHHWSAILQHEGRDEFDVDATFGDPHSPNEIAFALTDETTGRAAATLFSEQFGGEANILRDGGSIEDDEPLAYCNNPFRLPLNEFTYGEFKRRFSNRWTNLSVKLYDVAPRTGGLWRGDRELADDFEMGNLKHADKAFLHDYTYISTWGELLVYVRIAAAIRNDKFGVECEGNLRNTRLKKFNEAENSEAIRIMSLG